MSLVKLVIVLFSVLLITQLIFGSHLKHEHVKRNPGSSTNDTEIQGRQGSSSISLKEGEEKNKRKGLLEALNLTKYSERRTVNNNATVSFPWTTDKDPRRRRGGRRNRRNTARQGRQRPGRGRGRVPRVRRGRTPGSVIRDAFSDDINACLFSGWKKASIISNDIQCNERAGRVGLCYGTDPNAGTASFAVCYNELTLTPDFTGHVVEPQVGSGRGASGFKCDCEQFRPNRQSTSDDYLTKYQGGLYHNFKPPPSQQYLARGHLVPNADFGNIAERALTFITTNIAPQWQLFNKGNWCALERAIRTYVNTKNRKVYVFSGVGGALSPNIVLNGRVQTPKYFWKAVCDPTEKQSVLFYAENPVGIEDKERRPGCNRTPQIISNGVIECERIDTTVKRRFVVPNFDKTNCSPDVQGLKELTRMLTSDVIACDVM